MVNVLLIYLRGVFGDGWFTYCIVLVKTHLQLQDEVILAILK